MIFRELELAGAFVIELEPHSDDRGFFARSFCRQEFAAHGLVGDWVQSNVSHSTLRGTLRGMHWQAEPHGEVKLVRCTSGAVHDVIVDLRPGSDTRGHWQAVELTAANRHLLYVPRGFAHGFVTLADETEVFYEMSHAHEPTAARGFRHDDPAIGIHWPVPVRVVSRRDAGFADLPEDFRDRDMP